jgi:hypothetical protein
MLFHKIRKERNANMKSLRFQNWCNEIIISDNNDFISRKIWIARFLREEIVTLLQKKGYYLYVSHETLANEIASGLFTNNFNFAIRNIDNHSEDFDYWNYLIPTETWTQIFDSWQVRLKEFESYLTRANIIDYLWNQLNLNDSPASKRLDDYLYDTDEETEIHKEDPYLIDSANVGYSAKF